MSNAKVRHRRRWRRAHDRTYEVWKARMEKLGLWDFSRSRSWYDDDGKKLGHITVGGFGYY